jgi:phosphopentomutase
VPISRDIVCYNFALRNLSAPYSFRVRCAILQSAQKNDNSVWEIGKIADVSDRRGILYIADLFDCDLTLVDSKNDICG